MSALFWFNPGIVIGFASLIGCLYYLCVCLEDAKTLLNYWRAHHAQPIRNDQFSTKKRFLLRDLHQHAIKSVCAPALRGDTALLLLPSPPAVD